jgi:hypothetical protein
MKWRGLGVVLLTLSLASGAAAQVAFEPHQQSLDYRIDQALWCGHMMAVVAADLPATGRRLDTIPRLEEGSAFLLALSRELMDQAGYDGVRATALDRDFAAAAEFEVMQTPGSTRYGSIHCWNFAEREWRRHG